MTVLEELIEFALIACERGRASIAGAAATAVTHHHTARGAAALGPDGKVKFLIRLRSFLHVLMIVLYCI